MNIKRAASGDTFYQQLFNKLPNDCLMEILDCLSDEDVFGKVQLTSKKFFEAVNGDDGYFRNMVLKKYAISSRFFETIEIKERATQNPTLLLPNFYRYRSLMNIVHEMLEQIGPLLQDYLDSSVKEQGALIGLEKFLSKYSEQCAMIIRRLQHSGSYCFGQSLSIGGKKCALPTKESDKGVAKPFPYCYDDEANVIGDNLLEKWRRFGSFMNTAVLHSSLFWRKLLGTFLILPDKRLYENNYLNSYFLLEDFPGMDEEETKRFYVMRSIFADMTRKPSLDFLKEMEKKEEALSFELDKTIDKEKRTSLWVDTMIPYYTKILETACHTFDPIVTKKILELFHESTKLFREDKVSLLILGDKMSQIRKKAPVSPLSGDTQHIFNERPYFIKLCSILLHDGFFLHRFPSRFFCDQREKKAASDRSDASENFQLMAPFFTFPRNHLREEKAFRSDVMQCFSSLFDFCHFFMQIEHEMLIHECCLAYANGKNIDDAAMEIIRKRYPERLPSAEFCMEKLEKLNDHKKEYLEEKRKILDEIAQEKKWADFPSSFPDHSD